MVVEEPQLAAYHFAYMVLTPVLDRALLCGEDNPFAPADLERFADSAVRIFLSAYATRSDD